MISLFTWRVLLGIAVLMSAGFQERKSPMSDTALQWKRLALPANAAKPPNFLMLASSGSAAELLFTTESTGLTAPLWRIGLTVQPAPPTQAAVDASAGTPSDALTLPDGTLSLLFTRAGSARSQLFYKNSRDSKALYVNHLHNFGIFVRPHFVRHEKDARPAIAALGIINGTTHAVLFQAGQSGDYGDYVVLPAPSTGILEDARLLPYRGGYLLLTKMSQPVIGPGGQALPPPQRLIEEGVRVPLGALYGTLLNRSFQAVGQAVKILGDTPIFEFDADARAANIFILATTQSGLVYANGPLEHGEVAPGSRSAAPWDKPLASPSILANPQHIHLAILAAPGGEDTHIWVSEI